MAGLEHCVKRTSMLSNTSRRLKMLSSWISKLECLVLCRQMAKDWPASDGESGLGFSSLHLHLGETDFGRLMGWVVEMKGGMKGDKRRLPSGSFTLLLVEIITKVGEGARRPERVGWG